MHVCSSGVVSFILVQSSKEIEVELRVTSSLETNSKRRIYFVVFYPTSKDKYGMNIRKQYGALYPDFKCLKVVIFLDTMFFFLYTEDIHLQLLLLSLRTEFTLPFLKGTRMSSHIVRNHNPRVSTHDRLPSLPSCLADMVVSSIG